MIVPSKELWYPITERHTVSSKVDKSLIGKEILIDKVDVR